MGNMKLPILLAILLFVVPLVSGEPAFTFKQKEVIDLKIPCENSCPSGTIMNLTIRFPNGSYMLNSVTMTDLGNGDFNFTTPPFSEIGFYSSKVDGFGGGLNDTATFDILVTKSGEDREINVFLPLVAIIFFGIMVFIMGIIFDGPIPRLTFFGLAIVMAYASIQYTLIILQDYTFVNNPGIQDYYTTFFQVITWIISGAITLLIIGIAMWVFKKINIKKGFAD